MKINIASIAPLLRASAFVFSMLFAAQAIAFPADFSDELVVGGMTQPTDFAVLPSGEMLVLEKRGDILLTDPSVSPAQSTRILTVPDVDGNKEKGLLSIVLDPDYESNSFIYVFYHNKRVDRARISRYKNEGGSIDASSEFVIWEDNLTTSTQRVANHYGGGMSFGPDGYLYYTYGDKSDSPADSQDMSKTAGKILRLDTAGASSGQRWTQGSDNAHLIPDSNPFIDGVGGTPDEIWALGLRNPFRAKWDMPTGLFFIGEVGDNVQEGVDVSYEDVHVVTTADAGANFGYPRCEGPVCRGGAAPANYSGPIFSIIHPDSRAIIMGPVYRGGQYPDKYNNALFFGDYANGWLRYVTLDDSGSLTSDVPEGGFEFAAEESMTNVVSIRTGNDGNLYYLVMGPRFEIKSKKGQLRRIKFDNANQPPLIDVADASPKAGDTPPLTVEFTGSASDADANALTYQWDFGNGVTANSANPTHTYTANGQYEAVLTVSDGITTVVSDPVIISVGGAPEVVIAEPFENMKFTAGNVIQLRGSASDPDGTLTNEDLRWTIIFRHDDHPHIDITDEVGIPCEPAGSSCMTLQVPIEGHDFSGNTRYAITLEVTDSTGLTDAQTVTIIPDKVDLVFNSDFPGEMTVFLDEKPRTMPFVHDTLIGFEHSINAPVKLSAGGDGYSFSGWSNGPTSALQKFSVPAASSNTYRAFYNNDGPVPLPLTGLVAHFETDRGVSVDGSAQVQGWSDLSGSGNDLIAVGDPTLISDGLNGRAVIDFDGAGDALLRTDTLNAFPQDAQDRTVYMVASYEGVGSGGFGYGTPAANQTFGLSVSSSGNLRVNAFGPADKFSTTAGTRAGWIVQSARVSDGQLVHSVNGLEIDRAQRSYQTQDSLLVLGADIDQSPAVDMQVAALLVYNRALDESEQSQLQSYLQGKYLTAPVGNQAPVAVADTDTVGVDGTVIINVLANDTDDTGLAVNSVQIVSSASVGELEVNTDGTVSYTHDGGSGDTDTFAYTVEDVQGMVSSAATVTVDITGQQNNQAPVAVDDSATVVAGGTVTINVLNNDTDDTGLIPNSVRIISGLSSGRLVPNTDGSLSYTHDGGSSETDAFSYSVEDDQGLVSNTASVTIAITNDQTNQPPVAVADRGVVSAGGTMLIDILANDTDDVELAVNTVKIESGTSAGTLTVNTDGTVSYTHNDGPESADRFSYTVEDDQGRVSNTATVTLAITGVTGGSSVPQSGLVAHFETDSGVATNSSGQVTGWSDQSGQGNDLTSVGDPQLVSGELVGQKVIDFDGSRDALLRSMTLNAFPTGDQDRTVYMIASYESVGSGGFGFGASLTNQAFGLSVSPLGKLRINAFGTADVVSDQAGTNAGWIMQSARLSGNQLVHSVNGYEIDRATRSYQTQGNLLVLGADLDQTPAVDMKVAAVLVYDRALSNAEQESLEIYLEEKYFAAEEPGNQPPSARPDSSIVDAGGTVVVDVLNNDTDDSALNERSVRIVSGASSGDVTVNTDGTVSYTHDNSTSAQDNFTYQVLDDQGLASNTAAVTITITGNSDKSIPLSGLVGRFESDALVAEANDSQVTSWGDQTASSNTLIAEGSPTIVPSVLNGLPVIDFDGNDDVLQRLSDVSGLPAGSSDRSVYAVVNYRSTGLGGVTWGEAAINRTFGPIVSKNGSLALQGWGVSNDFNSDAAGTNQGWVVQSATMSDNTVKHFLNGNEIDSIAHNYDTVPNRLVVGAEIDGRPFVNMQIAAIFIYDRALKQDEQKALQAYFEQKYF